MGFRGQTALTGFGEAGSEGAADSAGTYGDKLIGGRLRVVSKLSSEVTWWAYNVRHDQTNLEMAVRIFDPENADDVDARALFLAQAAAVSMLRHPNTVALLDFGEEDDGRVFIATEPPDGKKLSDYVRRRGPMTPDTAVRVAGQILGSLAEAHAAGILHGELNSDNILVTDASAPELFVKVVDYGMAKMLGEQLQVDKHGERELEKMPYMSPEQLVGREIDERTDLYSLAVVMFEMLTGRLPYTGASADDLKVRKIRDSAPRLEEFGGTGNYPAGASDFLIKCLSARRESRPGDAATFRRLMNIAFGLASATGADAVESDVPRHGVSPVARQPRRGVGPVVSVPTVQMGAIRNPSVADRSGKSEVAAKAAGSDRRRSRRSPRLVSARCAWRGETIKVMASDASTSGGFINSPDLPPIGGKVILGFMDPDSNEFGIQVLGLVTRVVDGTVGTGDVRGFGVKWLRLRSAGEFQSVAKFVEKMFGIKFPPALPAGIKPQKWEYLFEEDRFI